MNKINNFKKWAIPEMNKGMKDSNEALQKALEGQKQIEDVICK